MAWSPRYVNKWEDGGDGSVYIVSPVRSEASSSAWSPAISVRSLRVGALNRTLSRSPRPADSPADLAKSPGNLSRLSFLNSPLPVTHEDELMVDIDLFQVPQEPQNVPELAYEPIDEPIEPVSPIEESGTMDAGISAIDESQTNQGVSAIEESQPIEPVSAIEESEPIPIETENLALLDREGISEESEDHSQPDPIEAGNAVEEDSNSIEPKPLDEKCDNIQEIAKSVGIWAEVLIGKREDAPCIGSSYLEQIIPQEPAVHALLIFVISQRLTRRMSIPEEPVLAVVAISRIPSFSTSEQETCDNEPVRPISFKRVLDTSSPVHIN